MGASLAARVGLAKLSLPHRDRERASRLFEEGAGELAIAIKRERGSAKGTLVYEATQLHD